MRKEEINRREKDNVNIEDGTEKPKRQNKKIKIF